MGKVIAVTSFEEMERAANNLRQISESYTEIYTKMMEDAQTMGAAWDGADNLAFVEQITGFTSNLKAMAEKLVDAAEAMDQQRLNYVNRQNDNITQVKKLAN